MRTTSKQLSNTEMVKEFIDTFIGNIIYAFGVKTFKIKFLYSAMFTIMLSPVVYIFDFVRDFLIPEKYFFQTIVFLCVADAVIGVGKAFKLGKFNPMLLVVGLATKLGVSYVVLQVFQAITGQPEFISTPEIKNYFTLIWKLMLMFYPCISFFNNIYYVSDKRFPPKWWMKRQANFQEDGDIEKLIGKQIPNEKE